MDKEAALRQQIANDDRAAMLHGLGARLTSPLKGLDAYNSMLEYSATGRMSTTPEWTPGAYSDVVDEAIYDRVKDEHGDFAAGAYKFGTKAFDGITSYAALGPTGYAIKSAGDTAYDSLNLAKSSNVTDKQAAQYAFWNSAGDLGSDFVGQKLHKLEKKCVPDIWDNVKMYSDNSPSLKNVGYAMANMEQIYSKLPRKGKEYVEKALLSSNSSVAQMFDEDVLQYTILKETTYDKLVKQYKQQKFSDAQAKHIAMMEMIKRGGVNVLDDIALDAAQRNFYEALKRSLKP